VVEILSRTGKTIGELLADLPKAYNTPEIRIDTTEEKKHTIVERLKRVFTAGGKDFKVSVLDGIRVTFPDGWALARAPNTQAVLVLRFEANSPASLAGIRGRFEEVIQPLL
jgi:phosphomannomutase